MICLWLLHPGSRWGQNVFISSEIGSQWRTILGHPPADWVHGYLYFEPGAWIWKKGFRRHLHIVKNWSGNFSLNSTRVRALGWLLLGIFFLQIFWFFWGGFVGQIIDREYIVFRGSNIFCSLATWTHTDRRTHTLTHKLVHTHTDRATQTRPRVLIHTLSLARHTAISDNEWHQIHYIRWHWNEWLGNYWEKKSRLRHIIWSPFWILGSRRETNIAGISNAQN